MENALINWLILKVITEKFIDFENYFKMILLKVVKRYYQEWIFFKLMIKIEYTIIKKDNQVIFL